MIADRTFYIGTCKGRRQSSGYEIIIYTNARALESKYYRTSAGTHYRGVRVIIMYLYIILLYIHSHNAYFIFYRAVRCVYIYIIIYVYIRPFSHPFHYFYSGIRLGSERGKKITPPKKKEYYIYVHVYSK